MGLSDKDVARLGPGARAQIEAMIDAKKKAAIDAQMKNVARRLQLLVPPKTFDSQLECDFYYHFIHPRLLAGEIVSCETHKSFRLWEKDEYCGVRLPKADFTPDFILEYRNGHIEAVEVKSRFVRKMQRDFVLRRRLFIDRVCRPQGWGYREVLEGVDTAVESGGNK